MPRYEFDIAANIDDSGISRYVSTVEAAIRRIESLASSGDRRGAATQRSQLGSGVAESLGMARVAGADPGVLSRLTDELRTKFTGAGMGNALGRGESRFNERVNAAADSIAASAADMRRSSIREATMLTEAGDEYRAATVELATWRKRTAAAEAEEFTHSQEYNEATVEAAAALRRRAANESAYMAADEGYLRANALAADTQRELSDRQRAYQLGVGGAATLPIEQVRDRVTIAGRTQGESDRLRQAQVLLADSLRSEASGVAEGSAARSQVTRLIAAEDEAARNLASSENGLADIMVERQRVERQLRDSTNRQLAQAFRSQEDLTGNHGTMWQRAQRYAHQAQGGAPRPIEEFPSMTQTLVGRGLQSVGYAASGILLYGAITQLRDMITNSEKLQRDLAQINVQLQQIGQGNQFANVRQNILSVAGATGVAASSLTEVEQSYIGLYQNANQANEATKATAELMVITGQSSDQLAQSLGPAATDLGASVRSIGDLAVDASNKTGKSVSDMVTAFGTLAPVAAQLHMGGAQGVHNILTAFSRQSALDPNTIAESLTRTLPDLNQRVATLMQAGFKLSPSALQGNVQSLLKDILSQVNNIPGGQNIIDKMLGNPRDQQVWAAVFANTKQALQALNSTASGSGDLAQRNAAAQQQFSQALGRIKQDILGIGDDVWRMGLGRAMVDAATAGEKVVAVLDAISRFAGRVNSDLGGLPGVLAAIGIGVGGVLLALKAISFAKGVQEAGLLVTIINKIKTAIDGATKAEVGFDVAEAAGGAIGEAGTAASAASKVGRATRAARAVRSAGGAVAEAGAMGVGEVVGAGAATGALTIAGAVIAPAALGTAIGLGFDRSTVGHGLQNWIATNIFHAPPSSPPPGHASNPASNANDTAAAVYGLTPEVTKGLRHLSGNLPGLAKLDPATVYKAVGLPTPQEQKAQAEAAKVAAYGGQSAVDALLKGSQDNATTISTLQAMYQAGTITWVQYQQALQHQADILTQVAAGAPNDAAKVQAAAQAKQAVNQAADQNVENANSLLTTLGPMLGQTPSDIGQAITDSLSKISDPQKLQTALSSAYQEYSQTLANRVQSQTTAPAQLQVAQQGQPIPPDLQAALINYWNTYIGGAVPQALQAGKITLDPTQLTQLSRQSAEYGVQVAQGQAAVAKAQLRGDPVAAAQQDVSATYQAWQTALSVYGKGSAEEQNAYAQYLDAGYTQLTATRQVVKDQTDLLKSQNPRNQQQQIAAATNQAAIDLANAKTDAIAAGYGGKLMQWEPYVQALAQYNNAVYAGVQYNDQFAQAQGDYQVALDQYHGNVIKASADTIKTITDQMNRAKAEGADPATLQQYQTQLIQARTQAAQETISFVQTSVQNELQLQQISVGQAVAQLRGLEAVATTQAERQQLEVQIRQLMQQAASSADLGTPTGGFNLPTLYEARRLTALGGQWNGAVPPGTNLTAPQTTNNVQIIVANQSDMAGAVAQFASVLSGSPRYGGTNVGITGP